MRRLVLIRHGKSSWKDDALDDHERPLNARGDRDRFTIARHLADSDEALDVVYSSTAIRALDCAHIISEFTGVALIPDLAFYTFDSDELIEIIRNLPDEAMRVAIVGHNPAIGQTASRLTNTHFEKFPTSAIAGINADCETWADIHMGACDLDYFTTPKLLNSSAY